MEIEFLGTGTSTGVPQIGCTCSTCQSTDTKDKRLRASILVKADNANILIDCGPDFRCQMIRAGAPDIDALLLTHSHYDHVGGIDDIRPYCKERNFPIYCKNDVARDLRNRIPYCFRENLYPGVPKIELKDIDCKPFDINGIKIEPLSIMHYKLPILGFKIGNFAYITDAKIIPDDTLAKIKGIDTLVINALRYKEHLSHISVSEALNYIKLINPRKVYLIHMSHDIGLHSEVQKNLPDNVSLSYDGLVINVR